MEKKSNGIFLSFPLSFQGWSVAAHIAIRLLSALIASISLTALTETKDLEKKQLSSFMACYKVTELLSYFSTSRLVFTSSSHITDCFLSRVDEKLIFFWCVCVCVSGQRSKTKESHLSLSAVSA